MSTNTLKIRVKNFLAMNRISNSEFAEIAGVSSAYVTSIKENMSLEMLKKVYDINPSVSLPWLLWGVGDMKHLQQLHATTIYRPSEPFLRGVSITASLPRIRQRTSPT